MWHLVILLTSINVQELGLVAGIPVGTSLIDAHAGGVGVMESMPPSDSEAKGYHDTAHPFFPFESES